MLQTDTLNDPIVEILRFAYRRGLVILQEKEQRNELRDVRSLDEDACAVEAHLKNSETLLPEKVKGGK